MDGEKNKNSESMLDNFNFINFNNVIDKMKQKTKETLDFSKEYLGDKQTLIRLVNLQKTVTNALLTLGKQGKSKYVEDVSAYLTNMQNDLAKLNSIFKGEKSAVVGVFGCPSRGKSSLLNVLLGADILPRNGIPGTTRLGTTISYKEPADSDMPYKLIKRYSTKRPEEIYCKEDYLKSLLADASTEANFENPDIISIEVEGPFKPILGEKITFVDTPGIELGAKKEDLRGIIDHDFEADANRALEILNMADIVIFCMTLKNLESAADVEFYIQEMKDKFHPINVITAGDVREGMTDDEIILAAARTYKLQPKDTVIVSSKEALTIINDPKNKNESIAAIIDSEFKGANLEGFKKLKEKIGAKISKKQVEEFEEHYHVLKKDAKDKGIKLPELAKFLLF